MKKLIAIISTEGKTNEQVKLAVMKAVEKYQEKSKSALKNKNG